MTLSSYIFWASSRVFLVGIPCWDMTFARAVWDKAFGGAVRPGVCFTSRTADSIGKFPGFQASFVGNCSTSGLVRMSTSSRLYRDSQTEDG